jgi:hypothetical protein
MVPGMLPSMDTATKTRENRLRQMAARQRMTLHRSRRRDPRAWDYGRYWLAPHGGGPVIGAESGRLVGDWPGLTLAEVEDWLTRPPGRA